MVVGVAMIKILFEDNHCLVVEKPVNVPTQEDDSHDPDLLSLLKEDLRIRYNKPGNVYLGLIHRLDRPVGGVMVFAKTSKAASRLSDQVRTHKFGKSYLAIIEGKLKTEQDTLIDYLIKDPKSNTVKITSASNPLAKKAILHYKLKAEVNGLSLIEVQLETGRSHQIRVQFASRNLPLWGDQRYNPHAKPKQQIALWAYQLSFDHPVSKERCTFSSQPAAVMPFNQFSIRGGKHD